MTDMVTGMSQSSDPAPSSQPAVNAPASESVQVSQPAERTFKQADVNDIVKRAKQDAIDTYRRMEKERPDYVQQKYGDSGFSMNQTQPVNQPQQSMPNESDYRKIAAEEAQRLRDQWVKDAQAKSQEEMAQRTVQNFWQKVNAGKEKYQDFEKVTGDVQYARFPNVVQLLADYVDNAHDVMYELGKDRIKMANLEALALMSPQDAIVHAQRLSESIKDNESAGKARIPNEPLSQMRPSNTGTDTGVMSVKDFRKKHKV